MKTKGKKVYSFLGAGALGFLLLFSLFLTKEKNLFAANDFVPTENSSVLNSIASFLHRGAGEQYVDKGMRIAEGSISDALANRKPFFDATNNSARASFFQRSNNDNLGASANPRRDRSFLGVLHHFYTIAGKVFIGVPLGYFNRKYSFLTSDGFGFTDQLSNGYAIPQNTSLYLWTNTFGNGYGTQMSATLQQVNVDGLVRVSALSHQDQEKKPVCVDARGVFTLECPDSASGSGGSDDGGNTYTCSGSIPSHASACAGDDQGLSQDGTWHHATNNYCSTAEKCEYTCNSGYAYTNGTCEQIVNAQCGSADGGRFENPPQTNLCASGTASTVTESGDTYSWTCSGENGGADASCSATKITYHWVIGEWSACTEAGGECIGSWTEGGECTGDGYVDYDYYYYDDPAMAQGDRGDCSDYVTEQSCSEFNAYIQNCLNNSNCLDRAEGSCTWNPLVTHQCSDSNPSDQQQCELQNENCEWQESGIFYKTRSVDCVDDLNNIVSDAKCSAPKPDENETCPNNQYTCNNRGVWELDYTGSCPDGEPYDSQYSYELADIVCWPVQPNNSNCSGS